MASLRSTRTWLRALPLPRSLVPLIQCVVGCTLIWTVEPGSLEWWGLLTMNAASAIEAHLVARDLRERRST